MAFELGPLEPVNSPKAVAELIILLSFCFLTASWIVLAPIITIAHYHYAVPIIAFMSLFHLIAWRFWRFYRFIVSVVVLGYYAPLYKCADLWTRSCYLPSRPAGHAWAEFMRHYFDIRVIQYREHDGSYVPLYTDSRCLYFYPHRCWADFFMTRYLCDGRASSLSRELIKWVFLPFWFSTVHDRSLWFFDNNKVGRSNDRKQYIRELSTFLDDQFDIAHGNGLIVFPEGRRNLGDTPLPLKRGLIYYAHSRNLPIQVIMMRGLENVISETALDVKFGESVYFRYGPVIHPQNLSREEFAATVQSVFAEEFERLTKFAQEQQFASSSNRCITNPSY